MDLTPENKDYIDSLDYKQLLRHWRFAPVGDKWMQGETGEYWGKRMNEIRILCDHVAISKQVGFQIH